MSSDSRRKFEPVIVVHGGAWSVPDGQAEATLHGVKEAAKSCYKLLLNGSDCMDAVVGAVSILEDDPLYDAGRGSELNKEGEIEMHAMVMRGDSLDSGAVVSVKNIKNPAQAARIVLEKSEHCLLGGAGAETFARKNGLEEMPPEYFITDDARKKLEAFLKSGATVDKFFHAEQDHDTVGAVAMDTNGNVACATTTGGITGQMPGRISDSPLPGCGGYADNNSVAVSSTGHGESIIKTCLCRLIAFHVEQGDTPQKSVVRALEHMQERAGGKGGAIAVDRLGRVGIHFTSKRMSWAVIGNDPEIGGDGSSVDKNSNLNVTFGINPNDRRTEDFDI